MKLTRRESREAAFLLIFEYETRRAEGIDIRDLAPESAESFGLAYDDYSLALAGGVGDNLEALDAIIQRHLKDWKIGRISKVSLAVLRCCVYEFFVGRLVDAEISINEAVELSKKYALPEETSFVNGVLGSVSREGREPGDE